VTINGSYDFAAPAEVIFNVLTDPDRVSRWLPAGAQADEVSGGTVRIRAGARVEEYRVAVTGDQLRVDWRAAGVPGLAGTARVQDAPGGGSRVDLEVQVPEPGPDERRGRELMAETMRHLSRDVSDNFNAG